MSILLKTQWALLTNMILNMEGIQKHTFTGYEVLSDIILLTNRDHTEVTLNQIKNGNAKTFNAGVVVRTKDLREILEDTIDIDI